MKSVVICGYARSPFCFATKGELAKTRADDMAATVIRALIDRIKVNQDEIEDLMLGCAFPEGEQGLNVARLIGFLAKLPLSVAGVTLNRFCGSSMQSVHMAAGAIQMGAGEVFICAGVESMSRVPMSGFNPMPNPELAAAYPAAYMCIRASTTAAKLAELKPAFDAAGSVTAGTASPLTDGASAVLVASEDYAKAHGLPILARIRSIAVAGCLPEIMGIGPVAATNKALLRAGLPMSAIDIIELNEAFASQSMACIRDLEIDVAKVNLDGGALALGHPLGATGARIVGKAASLLKREGKKYALATQCIGGGQGIATILEAVG